jgi:hypothetical protein
MSRHGRVLGRCGAVLLLAGVLGTSLQAGPARLEDLTADDNATRLRIVTRPDAAASAPDDNAFELDDGAEAVDEARPVRKLPPLLAPGGASSPARTPQPEYPPQLMEAAKAAHGWLREVAPWALGDPSDPVDRADAQIWGFGASDGQMPEMPGAGPGHDAIVADPSGQAMSGIPHLPAGAAPAGAPQWQDSGPLHGQRRADWGADDDPLLRAIRFVRELLEQPITWLILGLVVLGQLVYSAMAQPSAPKTPNRRTHRRRRRPR